MRQIPKNARYRCTDTLSSEFGQARLKDTGTADIGLQYSNPRQTGKNVTQMHYANKVSSHLKWNILRFVKIMPI